MANVTMNNEKNGIEIRFNTKPAQEVIDELKANKFRWSTKQKMWYAKQTDKRIEFAKSIGNIEIMESPVYDLWEFTRTEDIKNHYKEEKIHDNKEIAKRIRTHLRKRFPMCKWSVRSDRLSVDVYLKSAPWKKDGDEVASIAMYAYMYTQSFNYDNSDLMTDYHDVNFYGTSSDRYIVDYDFKQSEYTGSEKISELYYRNKAEFEKAEEIRRQKEFEEAEITRKFREQEAEKRNRVRQENIKQIEEKTIVENLPDGYFITNLIEGSMNKLDSVNEYKICNKDSFRRVDAKVTRKVLMETNIYNLFKNQLLDDYSFLEKMGGSSTDDNRINSYVDWSMMSQEEKDTVKWYSDNCVAIYKWPDFGDLDEPELMMVIDPQGYSYARYVFFVDNETTINDDYKCNQVVSDEDVATHRKDAELIEDISATIIEKNNMLENWNTDRFDEYKEYMKKHIAKNNLNFSTGVIQQIEIPELKQAMYKLQCELNGVQEQFDRAGLKEGDKITIFKIDPWGLGIAPIHGTYKSHEKTKYAQYEDAVSLRYRPENKRKDRLWNLYNDIIIYDGWLDIPEYLLWDIKEKNGVITRHSKYLSCDSKMYDVILNYFGKQGISPIVNTYKPEYKALEKEAS